MAAKEIRFILDIPAEKYLAFYQGGMESIMTRALDGRTVRFPAGLLRRVVTRDGVRGEFAMELDANNRFVAIRKIRDL